jgi:hypothetical protein
VWGVTAETLPAAVNENLRMPRSEVFCELNCASLTGKTLPWAQQAAGGYPAREARQARPPDGFRRAWQIAARRGDVGAWVRREGVGFGSLDDAQRATMKLVRAGVRKSTAALEYH